MEKTSQYQLCQWAPEDRILREDFNRDNANVEAGLAALSVRAAAEESARAAAITAEQQARTQAINSAKSQLESAKADKTALAALQAQVNALPLVKLREVTTSAAAVQVDVSMSGIDLTQYAYVLVVPMLTCNNATVYLRVNKIAEKSYDVDDVSREYLASMSNRDNLYYHLIRLFGTGTQLASMYEYVGYNGHGNAQYAQLRASSGVTPATVQTLNFVSSDSTVKIQAGGRIKIYGVKL